MNCVSFKIVGTSPIIIHSDKTANPMNEFTKQLKTFTSKRKKTEEDIEAVSRIEFLASLYYENGNYVIPSANIEATMLASAKQNRNGTLLKQAVTIINDGTFDFKDKNVSPDKLWNLGKYTDIRTVKVGTSKVMRTRPIFKEWASEFDVYYDDAKLNRDEVVSILENAGKYVGLGDYRPRYGRFSVEVIK